MTEGQFWDTQRALFVRMYEHARRHTPYYRMHRDRYGAIDASCGSVLELLSRLPILSKATLRDQNELFWSGAPALRRQHTTSGSTGTPLRLKRSLSEDALAYAIYAEWLQRSCGHAFPRTLHLSGFMTPEAGSDLYWRDRLTGDIYLSIYSLDATKARVIGDVIAEFKPQVISGYASAVNELALAVGDRLAPSAQGRIAVTTSEVLQPAMRANIEAVLCRKVYDNYGSQEGCHRVLECDCGGMHIHPRVGIVEIVDGEGQPVHPGEVGRVLVTGLLRRSMPLIRYDIGDAAVSTGYATDCPCGLRLPTIGPIQGRSEDLVVTRDGRKIGYLNFHSTKNLKGIRESQLVQVGYERFIANIVPAQDCDRACVEHGIQLELQRRLRAPVSVQFRYITEIPREARGKFRAVVVRFQHDEHD